MANTVLSKCFEDYKTGSVPVREVCGRILRWIFDNPRLYGQFLLDEDERSVFLLHLCQDLPSVLEKYDERRCSFDTYIFSHIKYYFNDRRRSRIRSAIYEDGIALQYRMEMSADEGMSAEQMPVYGIGDEDRPVAGGRKCGSKGVKKLPQKYQQVLLVVALKSVFSLTDTMLDHIVRLTDYTMQELIEFAEKLTNSAAQLQQKIIALTESRNQTFMYYLKAMHEMGSMQYGSDRYAGLAKKISFHKKALERKNDKLKKLAGGPSNKLIGELLNMGSWKVSRFLQYAHDGKLKKYIDALDAAG